MKYFILTDKTKVENRFDFYAADLDSKLALVQMTAARERLSETKGYGHILNQTTNSISVSDWSRGVQSTTVENINLGKLLGPMIKHIMTHLRV